MIQCLSLISVQTPGRKSVEKNQRGFGWATLSTQAHPCTHSALSGSLTAVTQCCRPLGRLTVCKPLFSSICLLVRWECTGYSRRPLSVAGVSHTFPHTHTRALPVRPMRCELWVALPLQSALSGWGMELYYPFVSLHLNSFPALSFVMCALKWSLCHCFIRIWTFL